MPFSTYAELAEAVKDWQHRSDITDANAEDWITLAEARLNRELNPVEEETTLTATVDSRTVDVSALSIVEPLVLYLTQTSGDEIRLTKKRTFAYDSTSNEPEFWAYDSDDNEINFNRPCDRAYSLRFQYRERFTLSDSVTTNWLLNNYPDVYLAAAIVWGNVYQHNTEQAAVHETILGAGIPQVRNVIAQQHRAVATVDPGITTVGQNRYYDYENDGW